MTKMEHALLGPAPHDEPLASMPDNMDVLGIPVAVTTLDCAVTHIRAWAGGGTPRMVFVRDVPSLVTAKDTPSLRRLHVRADLVVPDGTPLVWLGKLRGHGMRIGRVCGPDLMEAVCAATLETGHSHYFYGGLPGVAQQTARRLSARFPGLAIAGWSSPPMRDIDASFRPDAAARAEIEAIAKAAPDFIWVGLSSPKQEYWMAQAAPRLGRGIFLGVGAAFDYQSGRLRRAPAWMRKSGLEWLYRLACEPRRLWRRYLLLAPRFVWLIALDTLGLRCADTTRDEAS